MSGSYGQFVAADSSSTVRTYESPLVAVKVNVSESKLSPPVLDTSIEYYAYCGQYLVRNDVAPDTLYFSTSINNEASGAGRIDRAEKKYDIREYLPYSIELDYNDSLPIVEVNVSTKTGEKLFIDSSTIHKSLPRYMNKGDIVQNATINEHNRESVYFICGEFISMDIMEMDDTSTSNDKYKDGKVKKVVYQFKNGTITYSPFLPVLHSFLFIEPKPVQPANTPTPTRLERLRKLLWGGKNTGGRRYKTKRLKRRKHRKTARRRPKY